MSINYIKLDRSAFKNFLTQIKSNPLDYIEQLNSKHGPIFAIEGLDQDSFYTSDVNLIKFLLLKTHISTMRPSEAMANLVEVDGVRILGNGIITDQSSSWKSQKKEILKAVNSIPEDFLQSVLDEEFQKQVVDVLDLENKNLNFQKTLRTFLTAVLLRLTFDYYDSSLLGISVDFFAELDETQSRLAILPKGTFKPNILSKIVSAEKDMGKIKDKSFSVENRSTPPLQGYVAYFKDTPLSVENYDKLKNLWTSGGSTTVTLFNSFLSALSNDPSYYETLTSSNLSSFLKLCYHETLRLYPPIPILFRELTEDYQFNEILFKKGSKFRLLLYLVHRDSNFWSEPLKYDPYRFQNLDIEEVKEYYMPFGMGPRACVGTNLAEKFFMGFFTRFFTHYKVLEIETKGIKSGVGITSLFRDNISISVNKR